MSVSPFEKAPEKTMLDTNCVLNSVATEIVKLSR